MISIIIPNYNRADLIPHTLKSILEQSYTDWECIIVDDGSTDNSKEIIHDYIIADSRFSYYERPASFLKGANGCRNFGLSKAGGEFIKWVDSDDLLMPDSLKLQLNLIEGNETAKICFGYGRFFSDKTGEQQENWSRTMESSNYLYDHIINQIRWPIGGILWRRSQLSKEPFSPTLKNSQEWLMHSLALAGLKRNEYVNLPQLIYLIRRGNVRMSSSKSAGYYFNQAKSRFLLVAALVKRGIFSVSVFYQLLKQIINFLFHAVKNMVLKK